MHLSISCYKIDCLPLKLILKRINRISKQNGGEQYLHLKPNLKEIQDEFKVRNIREIKEEKKTPLFQEINNQQLQTQLNRSPLRKDFSLILQYSKFLADGARHPRGEIKTMTMTFFNYQDNMITLHSMEKTAFMHKIKTHLQNLIEIVFYAKEIQKQNFEDRQQEELNKNLTEMSLDPQHNQAHSQYKESVYNPHSHTFVDKQPFGQNVDPNQYGYYYDQNFAIPHLDNNQKAQSLPIYPPTAMNDYYQPENNIPSSLFTHNNVRPLHYHQGINGGGREVFQPGQQVQYYQNEGYNPQCYQGNHNLSSANPYQYNGYDGCPPHINQKSLSYQQEHQPLSSQEVYQDFTNKQGEFIQQRGRIPIQQHQQYPPIIQSNYQAQFQQYQQNLYQTNPLSQNNYQNQNQSNLQSDPLQCYPLKTQINFSNQQQPSSIKDQNLSDEGQFQNAKSSTNNQVSSQMYPYGMQTVNVEGKVSYKKSIQNKANSAIHKKQVMSDNTLSFSKGGGSSTHKAQSKYSKGSQIERKYKKQQLSSSKTQKIHRMLLTQSQSQMDLQEQVSQSLPEGQTPLNEQEASQVTQLTFSTSCYPQEEEEQVHHGCCHSEDDGIESDDHDSDEEEEEEKNRGKNERRRSHSHRSHDENSPKERNNNPNCQKTDEVAILADSIKHCNKKNVVKNIMSAFLTFMNDRRYKIYSEEEQRCIPALFRSLEGGAATNEDDKLEAIRQKFKRYIAQKSLNHYTVRLLIKHPNYGPIFKHFITNPIGKWIHNSKVSDLGAHVKMIGFFHACFENPDFLQELKRHEKKRAHFS